MSTFPITDWMPEDDPILGLTQAFLREKRDFKVNLGVGAYKTASGYPLVLASIRQAEQDIIQARQDKEYLPIDGHEGYIELLAKLVFGDLPLADRLYGAQVIGGTGALRIGLDYLKTERPSQSLYLQPLLDQPFWNLRLCRCRSGNVSLLLSATAGLDFTGLCEAIQKMPAGSIIILHASCHNPTGVDPTFEQWQLF